MCHNDQLFNNSTQYQRIASNMTVLLT